MKNKIIDEILKQSGIKKSKANYDELAWKIDKYMPEEYEAQKEYYRLLKKKNKKELIAFFYENADMERMKAYMPSGGTIDDFVDYLIRKK